MIEPIWLYRPAHGRKWKLPDIKFDENKTLHYLQLYLRRRLKSKQKGKFQKISGRETMASFLPEVTIWRTIHGRKGKLPDNFMKSGHNGFFNFHLRWCLRWNNSFFNAHGRKSKLLQDFRKTRHKDILSFTWGNDWTETIWVWRTIHAR